MESGTSGGTSFCGASLAWALASVVAKTSIAKPMAATAIGLRMKAIVAGKIPSGSRLLPMRRVELLGIKRARIELRIAQNVRVIFAEDHLVIHVHFDTRRHPA